MPKGLRKLLRKINDYRHLIMKAKFYLAKILVYCAHLHNEVIFKNVLKLFNLLLNYLYFMMSKCLNVYL